MSSYFRGTGVPVFARGVGGVDVEESGTGRKTDRGKPKAARPKTTKKRMTDCWIDEVGELDDDEAIRTCQGSGIYFATSRKTRWVR